MKKQKKKKIEEEEVKFKEVPWWWRSVYAWHVIGVNPDSSVCTTTYYYILVTRLSLNFTCSASLLCWHLSGHESAVMPIQLCSLLV